MKNQPKKLLLILFMVIISKNSLAQNNAIIDINAQLRALFSPLAKPSPSLDFLYDMSAKLSDTVFYEINCKDTLETPMWQSVYDEMYHAAYDTTWIPDPDSLFQWGNNFSDDTIPIGIMNFGYYRFLYDALTTGNYFLFDTIKDVLTDKYPRPGFPYSTHNMFAAAPMVSAAQFSNPVFRIDPQFILFDGFNANYYTNNDAILKIDFGDGNGWIQFDPTIVTNWNVQYSSSGEKLIKTGIFSLNNNIIFQSLSRFVVVSATASVPPTEYIQSAGLTVGYYAACNSPGMSPKTVIYLSGIDILDFIPSKNRTVAHIYTEMIKEDAIVQLKNQGYSFIVVDYKNSRIDIRFNALYFVNLLEKLKCLTEGLGDQQFVVMGESMGGLVARFALTYMESDFYWQQDNSPFFVEETDPNNDLYLDLHPEIYNLPHPDYWIYPEKKHNTRLLITLDTPHQGANVPMSIQYAYKTGMDVLSDFLHFDLRSITAAFNLFLDGQAAQQMLIEHIDTKSSNCAVCSYTPAPEKASFFTQLNQLGNYPVFAKVVAMTQGSLSGEKQKNYYYPADKVPGDRLLDFHTELYARILWLKVPIFGGDLECKTNTNTNFSPNTGHIFLADLWCKGIKIKLKWFGIKVSITNISLLNKNEYANMQPYCVNPGGYFGDPNYLDPSTPSSNGFNLSNNYWILNLFHYDLTVDNGCVTFDSHFGLNGFCSANFDYSLCSDGLNFCFVPVQSALDYGVLGSGTNPLDLDIVNENINTKLSNTPVDMMIGAYNTSYPNLGHVGFRNNFVYNLSKIPNNGPHQCTYYSCVNVNDHVERGLLNAEIGDEDLFLENVTLPWEAEYETEFDIFVNVRNPKYEYPNFLNYGANQPGIYSKDADFIIGGNGYPTFYYNDGPNSPTQIGLQIGTPNNIGNYAAIKQVLEVCCENFMARNAQQSYSTKDNNSVLSIFPNPNNGEEVVLNFIFRKNGPVTFNLYSSTGNLINSERIKIDDSQMNSTAVINLGKLNLVSGLYFVNLLNDGGESLSQKITVNK